MKPSSTEPGTSSPPDAPGGGSGAPGDATAAAATPAGAGDAAGIDPEGVSGGAGPRGPIPAQRAGQGTSQGTSQGTGKGAPGTRRRTRAEQAGLSELPVDRPGVTGADRLVRPARLDRQLRRGAIDPAYSDRHLEDMVAKAAEAARETARAEGYATGWAEGRRAAADQARQQAEALAVQSAAERERDAQRARALVAQLGEAVLAARRATIPDWEEVADAVADGALRIARAALARELRSIDEPVADAVRRGLERIADPGEAVIHLHPSDAAAVGTSLPEGLRVVADPTVPVGGVVVLTPSQRLRLDLPGALAAAERVLRT